MGDTRRPAVRAIVVTVLSLGLMGMGGFGGGRETGLPAKDFRATFTDRDGARMDVNRVTSGFPSTTSPACASSPSPRSAIACVPR
jgi:hypothetical protein